MSEYKRLTNNNSNEYNPEYDFCMGCKFFGEPNGCNRLNGTCGNYERFLETYNRLAELENKIEQGTLIELLISYETELHFLYSRENYGKSQPPCIYSTKEWIYNVRHDGKAWFSVAGRGIGYFGEYLHEIGKTVFLTKAEAEKKLKELKEQQNER